MIDRGAAQLRVAPSGRVIGFDVLALVTICRALGYQEDTLIQLLPHAEVGLKDALREHGSSINTECLDPDSGNRRG